MTKADNAKTTNQEAQAEEEMKLLLADWQLEKRANSSADLGKFLNSKKANGELDKVTDDGDGVFTVEVNGYKTTISDEYGLGDLEVGSDGSESNLPDADLSTSYIGYYADFQNEAGEQIPDGEPDGIIYADLAIGTYRRSKILEL